MPWQIDETHDPKLESWVESANDPETDFPIQNLPLAAAQIDDDMAEELVIPIGDQALIVSRCAEAGLLVQDEDADLDLWDEHIHAFTGLNWLFLTESDRAFSLLSELRRRVSSLLERSNPRLRDDQSLRSKVMRDLRELELVSPIQTENYTDFYASLYHATNVGSMFRPDNPLLPNYKHIPIAYHGRASSIVPSGTPIHRPKGQILPGATIDDGPPQYQPCKLLDYELEVGVVVGRGNELGRPIPISEAEDHIFGLCLVNDWSARDIQKWEYQPLGPFLAKSFATTISPYIVTMEALAPFRTHAFERPAGDPEPLAYLQDQANQASGGIDLTLEVYLASEQMRKRGMDPIRLSKGSFKDMYWTIAQMVAHHTCNGCNLQSGDLLASGTVSGTARDARGSLLELTWDGDPFSNPPKIVPGTQRTPIKLPTGEERKFLLDGDEIILKGYCQREGYRRIGFGECRGMILPAVE